jgi:group I intron endonuclease
MNSGIYAILNKANNKFYLGSAQDFDVRWKNHINDLVGKRHHSPHLQHAWDYYGEEYFEFVILEEVSINDLIKEEQSYLDNLRPWDQEIGYNVSKDASANMRGMKNPFTLEDMERRRTRMLGNTITLGYKHTEETLQRMSAFQKGRKMSDKNKEELRERNSKVWPGLIAPDGTIYENIFNLSAFCREHNLNQSAMQQLLRGKGKVAKGWKALISTYVRKPDSKKGKPYRGKLVNSRIWEGTLISPAGEEFKDIFNMEKFCRDHGVNRSGIARLFRGEQINFKGWRLIK